MATTSAEPTPSSRLVPKTSMGITRETPSSLLYESVNTNYMNQANYRNSNNSASRKSDASMTTGKNGTMATIGQSVTSMAVIEE